MKYLDLRAFCLLLALWSFEAVARFYPINGGMVNQQNTVTTASSTTTFAATGNQTYIFEGSQNQTALLPPATSLPVDWWYELVNNSTGTVTVNDGSGALLQTLAAGQVGHIQLSARSNSAGTWKKWPWFPSSLFYLKSEYINATTGAADAGKPIKTNSSGVIDPTFLPSLSSPLTTKGDIFGFSNKNDRFPVGSDGFIFTADSSQPFGYKWAAAPTSGINQLTGDVAAGPGSGSQAATVVLVGGSSAANVHAAELLANAATNTNTASAVVKRDGSGNFTVGTITGALTGIASGNELPLTFSAPLLRTVNTISCVAATGSVAGCLSITAQTIAGAKTFSDTATFSVAGASGLGAVLISGTPFSGTGTTAFPMLAMVDAASSTTWNTSGTYFGINAKSGFAGNLIDAQANNSSAFSVAANGGVTIGMTTPALSNPGLTIKATTGNNAYIYLYSASGGGPTILDTGNNGSMQLQNSSKNIFSSDGAGHIGCMVGAANGAANLDSFLCINQTGDTTHNTIAATLIGSQTGDLFTGYAADGTTKLFRADSSGKVWGIGLDAGSAVIANVADPATSQQAATKNYVDTAVSNNSIQKDGCAWASVAALPTIIYANGSSGVGATITGFAFGALSIDGNSPSVGDRVLIKNQVTKAQNGIYTVTATGSAGAVFVLTRATDYNTASEILNGTQTFIAGGATLASTQWAMNNTAPITVGTTDITFAQTSGPGSVTGGTGVTVTGSSIAITNVGPGAGSYTIPNITINAQGQITAATSGSASVTPPVGQVKTANYVATTGDDFVICNVATTDMTVTFYAASSASRKPIRVKNASQTGTCTVFPTSTAESIFAATGNEASIILSPGGNALDFEPDGSSKWYVF